MTGIYIRCTPKHACTRSGQHASPLPEFPTRLGRRLLQKREKYVQRKSCSADLNWRTCRQGKARSLQGAGSATTSTLVQSEFISNASASTRDSSVFSADWNVLLSVLSGQGGLVKCSRTAAWRVPLQLIKTSDNMIYGTHFAHKITGCNCLPDVFCMCCFFLSASAGKHQRTRGPENSGSLSRGVHASVSRADEGIKMLHFTLHVLH